MNEIHFDIFRVTSWTSVQLNEARRLEKYENYNARVLICSNVESTGHE